VTRDDVRAGPICPRLRQRSRQNRPRDVACIALRLVIDGRPFLQELQQAKGTDLHKAAVLAWQRFCALTMELPADESRPLWQSVAAEATIHVS
jgi:hypothetical protein